MSVRKSVWIHNHLPSRQTGLSPHDLWSKIKHLLCKLHDTNVFGCPVCVLQKCFSDGMSTPRWKRRSRQGVHVGMFNEHAAGSVLLILNFERGDITAQWNAVFDNWFSMVAMNVEDKQDFHADKWSKMLGTSTFKSQPHDEIKEPDQQLAQQPTRWGIEDNTINKEEEL